MYNKKCKNTFLFLIALLCLITFIVPFMNVGFLGNTSVFLKIVYYFTISIYVISIILIILIGVYSLFKNSYILITFQETLAYLSLIMLFINLLIFGATTTSSVSAGFSILALETFVMASLADILKLIRKLPRTFKAISNSIKEKRENRKRIERERIELENRAKQQAIVNEENENDNNNEENLSDMIDPDKVEIIPPDDEIL